MQVTGHLFMFKRDLVFGKYSYFVILPSNLAISLLDLSVRALLLKPEAGAMLMLMKDYVPCAS